MEHETESETIDAILDVVEYFAVGIEVLAVTIIVVGVALATYHYLLHRHRDTGRRGPRGYVRYRESLGRALLLGLEILVAADVVRTVALDPSLESMAILGLLVLIRTFLSWSLEVEIDRQWPWQQRAEPQPETPAAPDA
jgi:uncharacterized membrane protein